MAKAQLLEEKQAQLESIYDRHDSMVRELFHMENFLTMTTYDPTEAKRDESVAFRQWKMQHDLLDKAESSSTVVQEANPPTRQTKGRNHDGDLSTYGFIGYARAWERKERR
ncbi:hypothetical protein MPER_06849 [Moniliophthora perniciosa FA553]|nr:hypothetical protein MPER_06849 [Moniliophthora perniciosa FA553]